MQNNVMKIEFPEWLLDFEQESMSMQFDSLESQMELTLALTKRALMFGQGGPFGAIIWDIDNKLIAMGVNLVVPSGFSLAHAEMMVLSRAQQILNIRDLSEHSKDLILMSSCEPCAMCYGGTLWSGVKKLVYSASKEDAEFIGFHEGKKPDDWKLACYEEGIEVVGPVLPQHGRAILVDYANSNGEIYNSKRR